MHLTTAQSNLQQLKRRLVPRLRLETHCTRDSAATRPRALVPRLRLGTHCTRGSAATRPTQLRRQAVNHPTSTKTTPATTYTTLRLTTPQRTTTAPTTKQPTQNTNAPTTTPPTTTPNLASAETTLSTPQIKQKPWQPARVLYITLLRLLVATIGYIHRLRQRPPSYHGRSTSTASHRNHAYNTPSTAPSHRNHPLRSTPKTKTYNYDGNKYNYDDIAPSYDVLHNLRRRPYEAKEQSSPTCLNDMSQYRAYFVPGGMDPFGLQETGGDLLSTPHTFKILRNATIAQTSTNKLTNVTAGKIDFSFEVSHSFNSRKVDGNLVFANIDAADATLSSQSDKVSLGLGVKQNRIGDKLEFFFVDNKEKNCRVQCAEFRAAVGIQRKGLSANFNASEIASFALDGINVLTDADLSDLPEEVKSRLEKISLFELGNDQGSAEFRYVICADGNTSTVRNGTGSYSSRSTLNAIQSRNGGDALIKQLATDGIKAEITGLGSPKPNVLETNQFKWGEGKSSYE